jgi:hypothetical protein
MSFERNYKKNKLLVFDRKVLRRIFGSTKERDGTWRIKTNDALDELIHFIHLAVYLTTGPNPLSKRALHIVRSRASSFK